MTNARTLSEYLRMKCFAFALAGLLWSGVSHAGDWPIYRGPHHDGNTRERGWSTDWPKSGPRQLWKANVGIGFSSVSVSDGRVCTMGNSEDKDLVVCFDAVTGKELWAHEYEAALDTKYYEGGPGSTPTFDGDRVYSLGKHGDLFCFNAKSGKVLWNVQLEKQAGMRMSTWGYSGAPYPYGDKLLLNVGSAGMALDKKTGKVIWKSGDAEAGYSTPYPYKSDGKQMFAFSSEHGYVGVDPDTGKEAWKIAWNTRYGVNASDPIIVGDQIFISSGYSKGSGLFKLGTKKPDEIWRARRYRNQFNCSVLIDGHLYGFDGDSNSRAKLKCVNWETGEDVWEDGIGFGSLFAAGKTLFVLSPKGELMVGQASTKGFKPSARAKVIGGKCWTVPVLANGLLYCRNADGDLVCLDLRAKK